MQLPGQADLSIAREVSDGRSGLQATITPLIPTNNNKVETYTGVTSGTFKKRHFGHDHDMKEENKDDQA